MGASHNFTREIQLVQLSPLLPHPYYKTPPSTLHPSWEPSTTILRRYNWYNSPPSSHMGPSLIPHPYYKTPFLHPSTVLRRYNWYNSPYPYYSTIQQPPVLALQPSFFIPHGSLIQTKTWDAPSSKTPLYIYVYISVPLHNVQCTSMIKLRNPVLSIAHNIC